MAFQQKLVLVTLFCVYASNFCQNSRDVVVCFVYLLYSTSQHKGGEKSPDGHLDLPPGETRRCLQS